MSEPNPRFDRCACQSVRVAAAPCRSVAAVCPIGARPWPSAHGVLDMEVAPREAEGGGESPSSAYFRSKHARNANHFNDPASEPIGIKCWLALCI